MKTSSLASLAGLLAAVQAVPTNVAREAAAQITPLAKRALSGNPYSGASLYSNPYYSSEIYATALPALSSTASSLVAAASAVAKVPAYYWLDTADKVPSIADFVSGAEAAGADTVQLVVYDLPDRDCAAAASNGEYSIADNGAANYVAYIDAIAAQINAASSMNFVLVIEPDSLANLVTNLAVSKCANAQSTYLNLTNYAITTLNLDNVAMYLDAGHAGWLGWAANLSPAAELFWEVYSGAGEPSQVRGLATNVANYNAFTIATAPSYTAGDSNYDEQLYINALAPLLQNYGWTDVHFITDTGRSGKQPTGQAAWGDWCNAIGTGFGVRPTTSTGDSLVDAFVWVKPGGECDGTSNTSSPRYDFHCGLSDALQPAPEAGTWFEAYFEQLLTNANPALA